MVEPMRLGYLTSQYGRASDTFIRQEVAQLRNLGHTVITFSIRRPEADHVVSDEIHNEQVRTHYILETGPIKLGLSAVASIVRHPFRTARAVTLAYEICAPGFKAILWQALYFIEATYLARKIELLGIEHMHNHIAHNSASVCMIAAVLSDVTWSMTVHGPHDFVDPERWALSQKLESAAFSIFIAEFGRSQAMWHTRTSVWPKLQIVRCGLDETFLHHEQMPPPHAPRILFVGRLSPEKGVLLLIDAMVKLKRDNLPIDLVLIGDGPSRSDIEQSVARHSLAGAVTLLGWCSSERVREEILASRALVLPSFAEGLPIVLMEALALHRPVISTYVAGIPELVKPGVNGFLAPPGSLDELADAMRRIVSASIEELAAMGQHGAELVAKMHNSATNTRQLEALLWSVVGTTREASFNTARNPSA